MRKVSDWTGEDVVRWLGDQGLQEYCDALRSTSGRVLLALGPADFASQPLSLVTADGGKQLLERVETLRVEHHIRAHKDGTGGPRAPSTCNGAAKANGTSAFITVVNGGELGDHHHHGISNGNGPPPLTHKTHPAQRNGVRNGLLVGNGVDRHHDGGEAWIQIPPPVRGAADSSPSSSSSSRSALPEEWGRTGVALLYAVTCFVLTTVMISVVHERVPAKEDTPPLPDKFFDWFDRRESIVARRFLFIMGTLYLYRCVTMYITTLPVPGMHFRCAPKVMGDHMSQARQVLKMIAGGGLTITGSHHLCGDYLYSGHTVILTLCYLFIKEYSPQRFWWYHWLCWLLCAVGLFCHSLAHDHYSIDLFWLYHTMANQQVPEEPSATNFVSRIWWYRFFLYLEAHVQSSVPRRYQLPRPQKAACRPGA
ncbi:hypothetical protein CRUP_018031, partial [Coryphaenoides rupestris]